MPLRFITKHFRPNYTKLRDLDRVLATYVEPAMRIWRSADRRNRNARAVLGVSVDSIPLGATQLVTSESNYTWITALTRDQVNELIGEWVAKFQAVAQLQGVAAQMASRAMVAATSVVAVSTGTRLAAAPHAPPLQRRPAAAPPPVMVTPTYRQALLADTSHNAELFEGLQRIKYRYQEIAATNRKSTFRQIKDAFTFRVNQLDAAVHQTTTAGMYLTMYEELERTYERATRHGSANGLQDDILVAGGCYTIMKDLYNIGEGIGQVLTGNVVGGAKKIASKAADLLNVAGGLLYGIGQKLTGGKADYRRLTAQLGVEAYLEQKKRELLGETMESISAQVVGGPDRLNRAIGLFTAELDKIEKAIKHTQFWVALWKKDLAEVEKDFKANDTSSIAAVMTQLMRERAAACQDESGAVPSEVRQLESTVTASMAAKARVLEDQRKKLADDIRKVEEMLAQDLIIIRDHRAAIATRSAIASAQARSAALGVETASDITYNQHTRIAAAAAAAALSGHLRDHNLPHPAQRPLPTAQPAFSPSQVAARARAHALTPVAARPAPPPRPETEIEQLRRVLRERRVQLEGEYEGDDD